VDVVGSPARAVGTSQAERHMVFLGTLGQKGKLVGHLANQTWDPVEEGNSTEKVEAAGIEVVPVDVGEKVGLELFVEFDNLAVESHSVNV
jgi:hypothetical protein